MNDFVTRPNSTGAFRLLEHPSDLGIEATGPTLCEAFEQAALGLISVIADPQTIDAKDERRITLEAQDYENLLVRWLSEILYLYDGEDFLLKVPKIESLSPIKLSARLLGEKYEASKHIVKLDVKAVTYHQLAIKKGNGGTTVQVFLDI